MNGHKSPRPKLVSALVGNWVGIFGLVLAMCSLFAALCLIAIDFFHGFRQPYMGILIFLIRPVIYLDRPHFRGSGSMAGTPPAQKTGGG